MCLAQGEEIAQCTVPHTQRGKGCRFYDDKMRELEKKSPPRGEPKIPYWEKKTPHIDVAIRRFKALNPEPRQTNNRLPKKQREKC